MNAFLINLYRLLLNAGRALPEVLKWTINVGPLLYEAAKWGIKVVRDLKKEKPTGQETPPEEGRIDPG